MNRLNPYAAIDDEFNKLLFELEQVNLKLLLEIKQAQNSQAQQQADAKAARLRATLRCKSSGKKPLAENTGQNLLNKA
jgi:hypothetical protein